MIKTKFSVKDNSFAKIVKTTKAIDKASFATVEELAELGKNVAKQYAPYSTGQTYKSIKKQITQNQRGPVGTVYIETKPRYDTSNLTTKDVAYLLANPGRKINNHTIPKGWIRSGSRNFMRISREWINRRKKAVAIGNFRKIQIR